MIIQPITKKEEAELATPFKNDLVLIFNEIRKEMKERIRGASSPQEALNTINVLDEPLEE